MTNLDWCQDFFKHGLELFPDKERQLRLALICFLSRGHLLIEDDPGVGKTTFVQYLSQILGLKFKRLQMTPDMLPQDLVGANIFHPVKGEFIFQPGPLFTEFLLCDELNRANPKTQSALLESMEERSVSVDGTTHLLPNLFFVVCTQNPYGQIGTNLLPESQLDRFLFKIHMGYPDKQSELKLLQGKNPRESIKGLKSIVGHDLLNQTIKEIDQVVVSSSWIEEVWSLLDYSRKKLKRGLSPRSGLDLVKASKTRAYLEGRKYVIPDDYLDLFPYISTHRIESHSHDKFDCLKFLEEWQQKN